jgi:tetratricopeptide (TPR) repeat protein
MNLKLSGSFNSFLFFISVYLVFIFADLKAQSVREWVKMGERSAAEKDFYGASLYFEEALKEDSSDLYILNSYCDALRGYNNYELAVTYYEKLVKADRSEEYPEAVFWYGTMLKSHGEYDKAIRAFKKFTVSWTDKQQFIYKKAQQEIRSCEFAKKLILEKKPVKLYNAGTILNSENADFAAFPVGDTTLIFSSLRAEKVIELKKRKTVSYQMHLYSATGRDSSWKNPEETDQVINTSGYHVANAAMTPDRKELYFSSCDENYFCRIMRSRFKDSAWSIPVALGENINLPEFTSTQPFITIHEGRKLLFFVSDRPGGKGKLDIWYSLENDKEDFSSPVNLGPNVNTIDDDVTPFFDKDSMALYFSSGWHYGLGGFDIFMSRGNLRQMGKSENLGVPFNSPANDFYYTQSSTASGKGFLSSNRVGAYTKKGETCCNDIWVFESEKPVKKNAADSTNVVRDYAECIRKLNSFLPLSLYFHNDEPFPRTKDTVVQVTYAETFEKYRLLRDKYRSEFTKGLKDQEKSLAEKQLNEFFKEKADYNYTRLNAFTEELLQQLLSGKKLIITVRGHASPLAENDYNINLSKRRISTFRNHLAAFKNAALAVFLSDSSGALTIKELPFGEDKADSSVSDEINDQKLSVFSPAAAGERRIEVLYIVPADDKVSYTDILFSDNTFDFGKAREGGKVKGSFK